MPQHWLLFVQKVAHESVSLADTGALAARGVADIDTVKAATTVRTMEKRIFCEGLFEGSNESNGS